jgi:predicted nucleic acid-binding protein
MMLYLDTSALVKLYVEEKGSDLVRQAVADARLCVTHLIAYAETRAAFARKATQKKYAAHLPQWRKDFEQDWPTFEAASITSGLVYRAGELADTFLLRGYDSIHLAAAEAFWQARGPMAFRIAVFDGELADAAQAMGISVLS